MPDRTINFGESESEATYQIQDTDGANGGGNFVIAKDTNAGRVLLEYNPTTDSIESVVDIDVASVTTGRIESQRLPPYDDIGTVAVGDVTDALQNLFSERGWADPLYRSGPAHGEDAGAFQGAALAPDGRVILAPSDSSNVGIFDPADDTYTSGPAHGDRKSTRLNSSHRSLSRMPSSA